jgi:hypothetical protein
MVARIARRVMTAVAASVLVSAGTAAAAGASPSPASTHCISRVSMPTGLDGVSRITRTRCFASLARALRAASDVVVPDDIRPSMLGPMAKRGDAAKPTTIIGIHWEHADRLGRDRIYFVKGTAPCAHGRTWQISRLDAGWDRIASSAEAFGGCGVFTQYRDAKFKGAARVCAPVCLTLGTLNDRVGSVRWRA